MNKIIITLLKSNNQNDIQLGLQLSGYKNHIHRNGKCFPFCRAPKKDNNL